jgi:hypothetical protein
LTLAKTYRQHILGRSTTGNRLFVVFFVLSQASYFGVISKDHLCRVFGKIHSAKRSHTANSENTLSKENPLGKDSLYQVLHSAKACNMCPLSLHRTTTLVGSVCGWHANVCGLTHFQQFSSIFAYFFRFLTYLTVRFLAGRPPFIIREHLTCFL